MKDKEYAEQEAMEYIERTYKTGTADWIKKEIKKAYMAGYESGKEAGWNEYYQEERMMR